MSSLRRWARHRPPSSPRGAGYPIPAFHIRHGAGRSAAAMRVPGVSSMRAISGRVWGSDGALRLVPARARFSGPKNFLHAAYEGLRARLDQVDRYIASNRLAPTLTRVQRLTRCLLVWAQWACPRGHNGDAGMSLIDHIDGIRAAAGFLVGLLVGLTGVGGGSLMTPLLVLLFGIAPQTAVGTDLLYASITKMTGSAVHGWRDTVEWPVVRRLASGSVPAAIMTLMALNHFGHVGKSAQHVILIVLAVLLALTSVMVLA